MTEADWENCTDLQKMLEWLRHAGRSSDRKLRLFAVACCRTVWKLLPDESTRRVIEVAELGADGQADPMEQRKVLQEIQLAVNTQYGVFLCGGCDGSGSTYAAMAAVAALDPALTFTWYMGQTPSETHTAWECVALARAQTAKEEAQEKRWQEWAESSTDGEDEPDDAWYEQTEDAARVARNRERTAAGVAHCALLRDLFGPLPFRPATVLPSVRTWNGDNVQRLAEAAYVERELPSGHVDPVRLAVLADAVEEAGVTDTELLGHLRSAGPHYRGCWAVDLLRGVAAKETRSASR
jgi:hypothetical protein